MYVRGSYPSRSIRLTAKGLGAIAGRLELFRAPCIACGTIVVATRFGAFTGGERHSVAQCSALVAGRGRPRIRKAAA